MFIVKTLLDGVKVGTLLYVPGNLTKGTCLNMVRGCCANDVQFNAICSLCSGEGGGYLGRIASLVCEVTSVKKAKLFLKVQVAKILFSLAVAPGNSFSKRARYHDNGIQWYRSGKAGLASPFQYDPWHAMIDFWACHKNLFQPRSFQLYFITH